MQWRIIRNAKDGDTRGGRKPKQYWFFWFFFSIRPRNARKRLYSSIEGGNGLGFVTWGGSESFGSNVLLHGTYGRSRKAVVLEE